MFHLKILFFSIDPHYSVKNFQKRPKNRILHFNLELLERVPTFAPHLNFIFSEESAEWILQRTDRRTHIRQMNNA